MLILYFSHFVEYVLRCLLKKRLDRKTVEVTSASTIQSAFIFSVWALSIQFVCQHCCKQLFCDCVMSRFILCPLLDFLISYVWINLIIFIIPLSTSPWYRNSPNYFWKRPDLIGEVLIVFSFNPTLPYTFKGWWYLPTKQYPFLFNFVAYFWIWYAGWITHPDLLIKILHFPLGHYSNLFSTLIKFRCFLS